jgi:hypothetical protein
LSIVPDICDFHVLLIAALSEFTPSTPSLTAGPTIDDSNFILNQMVQNQKDSRDQAQQCNIVENIGRCKWIEPPSSTPPARPITLSELICCGVFFLIRRPLRESWRMIFRINLAMLRGRILDYPPAFFPYEFPLFAVFHAARRCLNAAMLCEVILDSPTQWS